MEANIREQEWIRLGEVEWFDIIIDIRKMN